MVRDRSIADASSGEMEQISLDDLDEAEVLLTELKISLGQGNLILCIVSSQAYRNEVIQLLRSRFRIEVLETYEGDQLVSSLRGQASREEDLKHGEILIWVFPERFGKDLIEALNNYRELFYRIGVPSVVFLTPAALTDVIRQAPDFWRYRGGFHELKGKDHGPAFQALGNLATPLDLSYRNEEDLLRRKRINEYLLEKIHDKKERARILGELGVIHFLLSEYRKSVKFSEQALAISREIGDRRGEGNHLGNLGLAYSHLGEPRKAIEYYEQALKISREIGDRRGEGKYLGNLGLATDMLGQRDQAIEFMKEAIAIFDQIESPNVDRARRQLVEWQEAIDEPKI
jgi:tetratricopeptide (TPR) repeat protein